MRNCVLIEFRDFLARFNIKPVEELTIFKVLKALPIRTSIDGPWLAGGAIRRTLEGQEPESDFDFFFQSKEQFEEFCNAMESDGNIRKIRENPTNNITYEIIVDGKPREIQAIYTFYSKTPEHLIDSFDFTICQFALAGKVLFTGPWSLWDLASKRLAVHKITYPLNSMKRLLKYTNQGFFANRQCLTDLLELSKDIDINKQTIVGGIPSGTQTQPATVAPVATSTMYSDGI